MKKGDIRKQEILETAERLFCKHGYEQTGIQDILDRLNTSKGSFYHHFVSKEALLSAICAKRAEQVFLVVQASVPDCANAIEKLNLLFTGMVPLRDEKLSFLLMFLRIFDLPEGRSVRAAYCEALAGQFSAAVSETVLQAHLEGNLYCPEAKTTTDICLSLVNRLWVQICEMMTAAEKQGTEGDLSEMLRMTDIYRSVIEKSLSVPYGSLELINLSSLKLLNDQIHTQWND